MAAARPGAGPDPLAAITGLGLAAMFRGFPLAAPGAGEGKAVLGQFGPDPLPLLAEAAAAGRLLLHVPPGRMAEAEGFLAGLSDAGRVLLLREEGAEPAKAPSVAIPPPCLLANAGTPEPAAFAAMDAPGKRRMVGVLHSPLDGQRIPHARDIAYGEFLRWEIAGWLDTLAPKFNLHWIALRSGPGRDDNKANLDTAMRMRFYAATHVHYGPRPLEALRDALSGAELCVTTHPQVAGLAFAMGVPPMLVATNPREADAMAAVLGPLVFPPWKFVASEAAKRTQDLFTKGSPLKAYQAAKADLPRRVAAARAAVGKATGLDAA